MNRCRYAALAIMLFATMASATEAAFQSEDSIRAAARGFMLEQPIATQAGRISIEVDRLDPRLRLSRCESPLEAFLPPGGRLTGNATVGVRCSGDKPWTLYVPVKVSIYDEVLVAARPLARGTELAPGDLRLEERDLAALPHGYLTDPQEAVGQRLKRPLTHGAPLTPTLLEAVHAIQRGERVILTAQAGGVEVRMAGTALMAGAAGERIRVRNLSSQRVVEGTVVRSGIVRVDL